MHINYATIIDPKHIPRSNAGHIREGHREILVSHHADLETRLFAGPIEAWECPPRIDGRKLRTCHNTFDAIRVVGGFVKARQRITETTDKLQMHLDLGFVAGGGRIEQRFEDAKHVRLVAGPVVGRNCQRPCVERYWIVELVGVIIYFFIIV